MLVPVLSQAWVGKASQCLSRAGGVGSRFGRRLVSLREALAGQTSFALGFGLAAASLAVYRLSEMLDELKARYYAMDFPA
jgi:hypothetical protein